MFWHYVFSNNSAQIEKLLEKEDVTLKELMEEDELLQECQAQNKKLIDFLCQQHVLEELVAMVVTEPDSEVEYKLRFKHASLAAELLTAEVPAIVDKLAASRDLLDILCNFLSYERPLNPLLASFFSKVLGMLIHRRAEQNWYQYQVTCFRILDYLKYSQDFIPHVTHHIGTSAIMNLLHRLMCGVEEEEIKIRIHMWLRDTPLISLLIAKLGPESDWSEQASTEQLLCDLLDSSASDPNMMLPMLNSNNGNSGNNCGDNSSNSQCHQSSNLLMPLVMNESTVQQLVDILLSEPQVSSTIIHTTNVLIKMLLMHCCKLCSQQQQHSSRPAINSVAGSAPPNSTDSNSLEEISGPSSSSSRSSLSEEASPFCMAQCLVGALPQIHNMLLKSDEGFIETSYGCRVERLGTCRLRLIALIAALIETKHIRIHQTLAKLKTIPIIMDLFFRFHQNNFLHTILQQCVNGLLVQAAPPMASSPTAKDAPVPSTVNLGPVAAQQQPPEEAMDVSITPQIPAAAGETNIPEDEKMSTAGSGDDTTSPLTSEEVKPSTGDAAQPLADDGKSNATDAATVTQSLETDANIGNKSISDSNEGIKINEAAAETSTAVMLEPPTVTAEEESKHILLCQLIREGSLIQRILLAYEFKYEGEDASFVVPKGSLCGYRGHLRLIANAIADQCSLTDASTNKPVFLSRLIQSSLPPSVLKAWQEFVSSSLSEANAINEITQVNNDNMMHMSGDEELQHSKDNIHAVNSSLSFSDNGFDGPSSGAAGGGGGSLSPSAGSASKSLAETISSPIEDKSNSELFEKMCSSNFLQQFQDLNSMWSDREKCITFTEGADHDTNKSREDEDEDACHSSDEEDEADNQGVASMEVDELQDDWESVFDRDRNSDLNEDGSNAVEAFNPWSSAGNSSINTSASGGGPTQDMNAAPFWAAFHGGNNSNSSTLPSDPFSTFSSNNSGASFSALQLGSSNLCNETTTFNAFPPQDASSSSTPFTCADNSSDKPKDNTLNNKDTFASFPSNAAAQQQQQEIFSDGKGFSNIEQPFNAFQSPPASSSEGGDNNTKDRPFSAFSAENSALPSSTSETAFVADFSIISPQTQDSQEKSVDNSSSTAKQSLEGSSSSPVVTAEQPEPPSLPAPVPGVSTDVPTPTTKF